MPRKKKPEATVASNKPSEDTATAVATVSEPAPERPPYIDGPPVSKDGSVITGEQHGSKNWGDAFKAVVTTAAFEMGEDRRFKQRVFKFKEKPADDIIAVLKDSGFTYRAHEKSWTVPANAETRLLSDRLARDFSRGDHSPAR